MFFALADMWGRLDHKSSWYVVRRAEIGIDVLVFAGSLVLICSDTRTCHLLHLYNSSDIKRFLGPIRHCP